MRSSSGHGEEGIRALEVLAVRLWKEDRTKEQNDREMRILLSLLGTTLLRQEFSRVVHLSGEAALGDDITVSGQNLRREILGVRRIGCLVPDDFGGLVRRLR